MEVLTTSQPLTQNGGIKSVDQILLSQSGSNPVNIKDTFTDENKNMSVMNQNCIDSELDSCDKNSNSEITNCVVNSGKSNTVSVKAKSSSINEADLKGRPVVMRRPSKSSFNGSAHDDSDSATASRREELQLIRRRSSSVLEYKEHAHFRLEEELLRAQEELKLKDEEVKKLTRIREQMGEEIEELTASLFEEANKMVQDAHVRRMQAEKLLKEANAKIDVLQAEVTALKTLVITSTPSAPNTHLHPQIDEKKSTSTSSKPSFIKGHRRSTSHHNISREIKLTPIPIPIDISKPAVPNGSCIAVGTGVPEKETDPVVYELFKEWKLQPTVKPACPFIDRIMKEDILATLSFSNTELSKAVIESILHNSLVIEPVVHEKDPGPRKCSLTLVDRVCKHRMKLRDGEQFWFISHMARNRVTSVCNFYTYIRYIVQGLVKSSDKDIFWEIMRLRKEMNLAKLGLG